jgi:ABC-2 type transport system ATP-binding protein
MGKTIFFSTHILADVSEICTHVGIIEAGQLVMEGNIEELQRRLVVHRELLVTLLDQIDLARNILLGIPGVIEVSEMPPENGRGRLRVLLEGEDEHVSGVLRELVRREVPVLHFMEETRDMEAVFMRATKGMVT